jgi:hypothetical protein
LEQSVADDLLALRGGEQAGDRVQQRSSHRDPLSPNRARIGGIVFQESSQHSSEEFHDCGPDQTMAQDESDDPAVGGINDVDKACLPCQGREKSDYTAPWIVGTLELSRLNGSTHGNLLQLISPSLPFDISKTIYNERAESL